MKHHWSIYLDTNIYCRPLDNQKDRRINIETNAFLEIVTAAEKGNLTIISSDYVKFEIEQIIDPLKRKDIRGFERVLSQINVTSSRKLTALANEFSFECHLSALDSFHLASACIGKANYFLTCDDQIIDNAEGIEKISKTKGYKLKVRNPVKYLDQAGIE
jgi:predicted nucleic acid-binding protein